MQVSDCASGMSSIQNGSAGSTNGKTLLIAAVAAVSESQQRERFAIASFDVTTLSAKKVAPEVNELIDSKARSEIWQAQPTFRSDADADDPRSRFGNIAKSERSASRHRFDLKRP
jgi:hypothetical protein